MLALTNLPTMHFVLRMSSGDWRRPAAIYLDSKKRLLRKSTMSSPAEDTLRHQILKRSLRRSLERT